MTISALDARNSVCGPFCGRIVTMQVFLRKLYHGGLILRCDLLSLCWFALHKLTKFLEPIEVGFSFTTLFVYISHQAPATSCHRRQSHKQIFFELWIII